MTTSNLSFKIAARGRMCRFKVSYQAGSMCCSTIKIDFFSLPDSKNKLRMTTLIKQQELS